jgi:hypothetical protein
MNRRHIPQPVLDAAHARSTARAASDWVEADRLRAEIEVAGWKVVDRGTDFALSPLAPPDELDGAHARYGSSTSVPSRFDEAPIGMATVVLIATDRPDDLARALAGLRANAPVGTSIVIVADGVSVEQAAALDAMSPDDATEVVWTSTRLGQAAATNIGIRRAAGPVVVLWDTNLEPTGDIVTPLVAALGDPRVAIAGGWGLVSDDLRAFEDAPSGDVDALRGDCQAFRRADAADHGPLDEHFRSAENLAVWWSLVLRDSGEGQAPRRAVSLDGLPIIRHEPAQVGGGADPGGVDQPGPERDRQAKRDRYRIIDRFGSRRDLLARG